MNSPTEGVRLRNTRSGTFSEVSSAGTNNLVAISGQAFLRVPG